MVEMREMKIQEEEMMNQAVEMKEEGLNLMIMLRLLQYDQLFH